ncbi:four-helix bundle copper-binding protein [Streptomyces sp. NPDC002734]|uniref:four-helix bundle copper-binding protein n=1 Tax=Streptomyces sp. NPDC002734 TaxID=3154426 RepID=UPI0033325D90
MTTLKVKEMLDAYPSALGGVDREKLTACVEECVSCGQVCTACADACLSEDMVDELATCVRSDLDCADVCGTTARVLSRHTGSDVDVTRAMLTACAAACRACGEECAHHTQHDHCRLCAAACRSCEDACEALLAAMG